MSESFPNHDASEKQIALVDHGVPISTSALIPYKDSSHSIPQDTDNKNVNIFIRFTQNTIHFIQTIPEPEVWKNLTEPEVLKKYSRNHEFSIAGLVSLTGHILVAILIVAGIYFANRQSADMPIETVAFPPGGGGDVNGVGDGPGVGTPVEAASAQAKTKDAVRSTEPLPDITSQAIRPKDKLQDLDNDPEARRDAAKIAERGAQSLLKLEGVGAQLRNGTPPGKGQGGPGSGGGKGDGNGPGTGSGDGRDGGKMNVRAKRKLRWTITFNVESGQEYLRQLQVLGAILAVQDTDGQTKLIRNLKQRPVKLEVEDLQALNRINWRDDRPDSVEKLARALGLTFVPSEVIALFPQEFEKRLLERELAYRHKTEEEISETIFHVRVWGNNYQVEVTSQRYY